MVLKEKALVPMDAREFYAQIDKAYKELIDINKGFRGLRERHKALPLVWKN